MPLRPVLAPPIALWALVLVGLLGVRPAAAQLGAITGRVVDAAGDALPGASVVLRAENGTTTGTAAGADGGFAFERLTPGAYVVAASFVGYGAAADTVALAFGERAAVTLALAEEADALDEVVVEEGRGDGDARPAAGLMTIAPADLARVPMPGLAPDLAGYLLTRPGVVAAGDRGGGLFVRGGTPTQNLVLVDGMPLYQPFHIVGFYSAIPADLVSYADVYAGGFPARYGGRLSSVIDVQTRSGSKTRAAGGASVAPLLSTARLEVPLVPERVSLLASVRESVIERVAPELLGRDLPYRFGDRFVKLHAYLNATSSLSLTALRTLDAGDVAGGGEASTIRWRNAAYGARYTFLPSDRPVLFDLTLYRSDLTSRYAPFGLADRSADVESFGGQATYLFLSSALELEGGVFGRTYSFAYDLGVSRDAAESVTEGGGYLEARVTRGPVRVEPGVRVHSFPSRSGVAIEPRLRAAWSRGRHRLSAAAGRYHQEIVGLYNLRDVTDAFVAWAPSPAGRPVPRADHLLAGWEGTLPAGVVARVEAYAKRLAHTVTTLYDDATDLAPTTTRADGTARGVDVSVEVTRRAFYGYAGYGLASVVYERAAPDGTTLRFHPPHDRRHNLNVLGRYARGPWSLGVRWQYGSGRPFTQAYGFYTLVPVRSPEGAYRTAPGTTVLSPADLYAARLPSYHRLDATAERRFTIGRARVVLQAAVINAYDRPNLFDYDLFTGRRTDQLPLIPSLGLLVEVR